MAGELAALHTALLSLVAGINGTGSYAHNFSAAGAVVRAMPTTTPPQLPYASVALISCSWLRDSNSGLQADLTSFASVAIFQVALFVSPASAVTPDARVQAAEDALNDLLLAIEADPEVGSRVISMRIEGGAVDGAEVNAPAVGIAYARLTCPYLRSP